ncbi:hypothetical protein FIBSPDRAFT_1046300 [Athelia psychrophila]|uniref:F-box domain-containing protein n=1 Tax=Athelia psychrophila TaxID=1759441 RepID=A0A166GXL0_9AGAM|nr:hypothetical protein FIBSPDRAFT_1046300 [Fibularhizoctonia sp. CBS 109695]
MVSALIAQQLASLSLKLHEVDTARNALLAQVADLDAISRTVQAEYNGIFNDAAAIATLPNEILACIFEEMRRSEDGQAFLGIIAQVTRRWRDVATNTPRLWSKISVEKHHGFKLCALYLTRTKVVPFDLTVSIMTAHKDFATFVQLLTDHMNHCRRLTIVTASTIEADKLLTTLLPLSAPLLESFDMSRKPTVSAQPWPLSRNIDVTILAGGAPLLTTVRLSKVPCCLPPLDSVTALHLLNVHPNSRLSGETLRDALLSLKRLTLLEVEGQIIDANVWLHGDAIELPALQTLRIGADDGQHFASQFLVLYEAIDAPSLQVLSLYNFGDDDLIFLSTSDKKPFPALSTLMLIECGAVISQFGPIMRVFPQVETVVIERNVPALLSLLQAADGESVRWPRLRKLAIPRWLSSHLPVHEVHERLYNCVTGRIRIGHPIAELSLPNHTRSDAVGALSTDGGVILTELIRVSVYEGGTEGSQ